MIKTLSLLGIVAAGGLSICPLCGVHSGNGVASAAVPTHVTSAPVVAPVPTTKVVTLRITGMTCGGCVLGVRKVLTRLDGVARADVSYEKGTAVVQFDAAKVAPAQMIAAIRTLGYSAVVAE